MYLKKLYTILLIINFIIYYSCGSSSSISYNTYQNSSWLILIYMDGDNNLSDYSYLDIEEIQKVKFKDNIKVAVLQDTLGNNGGILYEVNSQGYLEKVKEIPEPNMGNPKTLENFVVDEFQKYPSERIALILWDHGNGWKTYISNKQFRIAAIDTTNNDYLYMYELQTALKALKNKGININLIGFDECLMGSIEVFYDLANYTDFIVASEYLEPATGWNYTLLFNKLNQNSIATSEAFAHYIVDAYKEAYKDYSEPLTMVAIQSSDINNLVDAINSIAQTYISNPESYYSDYLNAVPEPIPLSDNLVDLYTFAVNLNSTINIAAISEIIHTMNNLYKYINNIQYRGINIYLPTSKTEVDYSYFCSIENPCVTQQGGIYYNPFTSTLWDDFLKVFLGIK